jgi:hypothetical protein
MAKHEGRQLRFRLTGCHKISSDINEFIIQIGAECNHMQDFRVMPMDDLMQE